MKKLTATIILTAAAAFAQTQYQSTLLGVATGGTNVTYSCGLGGWALCEANNIYCSTVAGITSGYGATNIFNSVAYGYGAFDGAYNIRDCVAIGKNAGKNWRNRTGWVQIGDAIAYTNGYLSLKAEQGAQIGPRLRLADPDQDVYAAAMHVDGGIMARSLHVETDDYGGGYVDATDVTAQHIYGYDHIETTKLRLAGDWGASPVTLSVDSTGTNICVRVGDTLLGYLTITPPAAAQQ